MWICQRSQSQPRDVIESIFYHHPSRTVNIYPATSFQNTISAFSPIHHQLHPMISIPCQSQLFSTIIIFPLVSANVDSLSIPVWRHLPGPQSRHRRFSKSKKCNSSSFPCPNEVLCQSLKPSLYDLNPVTIPIPKLWTKHSSQILTHIPFKLPRSNV